MKITEQQHATALAACEKLQVNVVFINKTGEMFTCENAAANSVKGKKNEYAKVEAVATVSETDEELEDLITEIELNDDIEAVTQILTDENEGEQRQAVITACELRIKELENQ